MKRTDQNPWSTTELQTLAALWPHFSNTDVATMMGRTYRSVSGKAAALGLHKTLQQLSRTGRAVYEKALSEGKFTNHTRRNLHL